MLVTLLGPGDIRTGKLEEVIVTFSHITLSYSLCLCSARQRGLWRQSCVLVISVSKQAAQLNKRLLNDWVTVYRVHTVGPEPFWEQGCGCKQDGCSLRAHSGGAEARYTSNKYTISMMEPPKRKYWIFWPRWISQNQYAGNRRYSLRAVEEVL